MISDIPFGFPTSLTPEIGQSQFTLKFLNETGHLISESAYECMVGEISGHNLFHCIRNYTFFI